MQIVVVTLGLPLAGICIGMAVGIILVIGAFYKLAAMVSAMFKSSPLCYRLLSARGPLEESIV